MKPLGVVVEFHHNDASNPPVRDGECAQPHLRVDGTGGHPQSLRQLRDAREVANDA